MPILPLRDRIQDAIEAIPQRDSILRVALFGSRARGEARRESDIDLLIEFRSPVGFFTLVRIQQALEELLRSPVDLVTPDALSPYFRSEVFRDAIPVYEA